MTASLELGAVADVASFINEYYDAWEGADEDRIMSYYADDVVLQIPGALMEGKEGCSRSVRPAFITAFPGNHHLVKSTVCGLGVVTVEFSFEALHKGSFKGHAATGARLTGSRDQPAYRRGHRQRRRLSALVEPGTTRRGAGARGRHAHRGGRRSRSMRSSARCWSCCGARPTATRW